MELKPGYKQTEVGVIPEDWSAISLGNLAQIQRGASPRPIDSPVWFDENSKTGWLRISDVSKSNKYLKNTVQSLSDKGIANSRFVPSKSLVMSICATVGRPIITLKDVCIHDGFVVFGNLKTNMDFLYYVLTDLEKDWSKHGQTGSQMNLNTGLINSTKIPLPPTKAEQQAIAKALSDMDTLIQSLEQQIIKKQQIKQGAMQSLLNPYDEQNLLKPGWEQKSFDKVFSIGHGRDQKGIISTDGRFPILATSGEIGRTNHYLYDKPSVLIGRKGTIDEPQYMETPFWTIDTLFYTEVFKPNNAKFLFYLFCLIDWYAYNEASGVPSLSAKTILNIEAAIPPAEEQDRIAAILTEMDNEIAEFETRLLKHQKLKQGMMQNLLTGTVRLV